MKVIVMGCGKVGEQLSRTLDKEGHEVVVIDSDAGNLARLTDTFSGQKIHGVGFDRDILNQAGISHSEAFAATSPSDNANIIAARIARNIYHVPRVVARLNDPRRAEIYRRLGLATFSMSTWSAERIKELLTHTGMDPLYSFGRGEVAMVSIEITTHLEGHATKDLIVPGEIQVVVITREGEALIPSNTTLLRNGDIVYLSVLSEAMSRLEALIGE
jgi:trk system potassium uptake protein